MKTKLTILLFLSLLCINSVFSQKLYRVPARGENGQVIKGKWVLMSEEESKEHQAFKEEAEMKVEEPVDFGARLKKQVTTWTKGDTIRVETHIYDPGKVIAQEGYKPVDVIYVTIQIVE